MEGVSFVAHPFCVPLKLSRKHTKAFNESNESFGDMQRKLSTNQTKALRLDEYRSTVVQNNGQTTGLYHTPSPNIGS